MGEEYTSLKGQLLIAMPAMNDPRFHHALILICSHDKSGAMGLVLNNVLSGLSFDHMMDHFKIKPKDLDIFQNTEILGGGPVETARGFVLHKNSFEMKDTISINDDLSVTGTIDVLKAIIEENGPDPFLFILGYAGWTPGQLESEMAENVWLTVEPDNTLIFDVKSSQKWQMALSKLGIEPGFLSAETGHA